MASRLDRIANWEARASASHFNLDELAKGCSASPSNLRRFFIQKFGKPPQKWMDEQRLAKAADLLQSSGLTIKEIAAQLGYEFSGNFARRFRRGFGCSPSHYATQHG